MLHAIWLETNFNKFFFFQVRGAPAIAIVGCLSLASEMMSQEFSDLFDLHDFIESKLNYLVTARPTAVNIKNAADELISLSELLASTEFEPNNMKNE